MTTLQLARGYRFAGVRCCIRPYSDRRDLALVISDGPAVAAGVFTQNRVAAAPVRVSRDRVPATEARGVVICSGNANACTGRRGLEDARRMAQLVADALGCGEEQILVCSTGVIGRVLPMDLIELGIRTAAGKLARTADAFHNVTQAILTTDTRAKISSRAITLDGREVRLTGFAKGAAMIGPNLATMLAFLLTDAAVAADDLTALAKTAADHSFNCISVEGHTSTNDTLLLFANGQGSPLKGPSLATFGLAATDVCADLARAIAADAEGATHLVTIEVEGLRSDAEARQVAKTIADSALVETAIFGGDPNWGRFVSAAGYAGVDFDENELSLWLGDILLYKGGVPQPSDPAASSAYLKNSREVTIRLQFSLGQGRSTFWTCDLTYDYVRLNAEYTT